LRLRVKCSSYAAEGAHAGCEIPPSGSEGHNQTSADAAGRKYFYLRNICHGNLVLDVKGFGRQPGTPVILWEKKAYDPKRPDFVSNQLWYEERNTCTIRSAMNDFCLDFCGNIHEFTI
jgi:hypothetical protein